MKNQSCPEHEERLVRTKSAPEIRSMFNAISPTYDLLNHLLSLNIDTCWRRFTARKLVSKQTKDVLDVCCGTGDLTLAFARRVSAIGATARICAADFAESMVALASRKFAQEQGLGKHAGCKLQPLIADTLTLPFVDSSFDLVSVAFGIRNVQNLEAGVCEMIRVCRQGGQIAVLEFSQPRYPLFHTLYNFYFFRILPAIGRLISGSRAYLYLPKSVAKFPDKDAFVALLAEKAKGPVQSFPLSFGIATLYIAQVHKPYLANPCA